MTTKIENFNGFYSKLLEDFKSSLRLANKNYRLSIYKKQAFQYWNRERERVCEPIHTSNNKNIRYTGENVYNHIMGKIIKP